MLHTSNDRYKCKNPTSNSIQVLAFDSAIAITSALYVVIEVYIRDLKFYMVIFALVTTGVDSDIYSIQ